MPIIAEDLGYFEPEAKAGMDEIMHRFNFPGMKVLQFAFDAPHDQFLPHNWETSNLMVYPGTHDNDTTVGWWEGSSTEEATRVRTALPRQGGRQRDRLGPDFAGVVVHRQAGRGHSSRIC